MTVAPETASVTPTDSILARWRYLPKLIGILWKLAPWEMAFVGAGSLISGLVPIGAVLVLRGLVDSVADLISGEGDLSSALVWVGALLAVSLLENALYEAQDWLARGVRDRMVVRIEERLLRKASALSLSAFERPDLYDQMHRARQALDTRLYTSLYSLFRIPSILVTGVAVLAYLATAHIAFPLVLIVGIIPFHFATLALFRKVWILTRAQTSSERVLEYLGDLMTKREAASEVRLFGLGSYLHGRRQQLSSRLRRERYDLSKEHAGRAGLMNVTDQIAYGIVVGGVSLMILRGSLTVGSFAAYLSAAERFRHSVSLMGYDLMTLDADLRYLADLIDYLELSDEQLLDATPQSKVIETDVQSTVSSPETPEIKFVGLSFAYPGTEEMVLEGLGLTIKSGERVALVGRNGAGKSTLARLLLGLYRPTAGSIEIGGIDLRDMEPPKWRRRVAAVFQDYFRFELTAKHNIGFGDLVPIPYDFGSLLKAPSP